MSMWNTLCCCVWKDNVRRRWWWVYVCASAYLQYSEKADVITPRHSRGSDNVSHFTCASLQHPQVQQSSAKSLRITSHRRTKHQLHTHTSSSVTDYLIIELRLRCDPVLLELKASFNSHTDYTTNHSLNSFTMAPECLYRKCRNDAVVWKKGRLLPVNFLCRFHALDPFAIEYVRRSAKFKQMWEDWGFKTRTPTPSEVSDDSGCSTCV